ncbi:acyltransferase family protein [Salinibacterium sp. PAMC 21357]|uniref:acyltransferase family protein n=1 Tax=Salinibacterium sp. PAMC 21357 TaxID=1112215 RepID=UPI000287C264|nr:acyltransferase [Salinibacterium sp. PAMC 21357]
MPRIDALTGLRWWAAFFVFTYHIQVFAPLPTAVAAFLGQGFFGVTFFFVLSGFVLTWSASPRVSQSTFYWRRFARVYPAHFVALIFAIPVFYTFASIPDPAWVKPVDFGVLALSFVLLQGWSTVPAILFSGNPAAWTLTCEAFFYALHPYISRFLNRVSTRGSLVFVGTVAGIAFAYRIMVVASPSDTFDGVPTPLIRITEFAIGMGLAWAFRNGWRPRVPVWLGLSSLVGLLMGVTIVQRFIPDTVAGWVVGHFTNEFVILACALTIVAVTSEALAGKKSIFASRIQVLLGQWSFAFYLVHATFVYLFLLAFGNQPQSWWNVVWLVVLFVVSLLGAAGLHHFVEKPFERRIRAWDNSRKSRKAAKISSPTGSSTEPTQN